MSTMAVFRKSEVSDEAVAVLLRKLAPRAMRNQALLARSIAELRKRYEAEIRPTSGIDFLAFIRRYAENVMAI